MPKRPVRAPLERTALPPVTGLNRTVPTAAARVRVRTRSSHEQDDRDREPSPRARPQPLDLLARAEAIVDIHDLEDFPSNLIDGLPERLSAWVPSLIEHRCSIGE